MRSGVTVLSKSKAPGSSVCMLPVGAVIYSDRLYTYGITEQGLALNLMTTATSGGFVVRSYVRFRLLPPKLCTQALRIGRVVEGGIGSGEEHSSSWGVLGTVCVVSFLRQVDGVR
jgi:hypothetical protein